MPKPPRAPRPRKELTRAEAQAWLERRGVDDVAAALDEMAATGWVDDARYARQFAADKRQIGGWGDERIARVLRERGVDEGLIEEALGEGGDDQLERAVEVLRRRGQPPADDAERGRCFAALARRGFGEEVAYEAVRAFERSGVAL